MGKLKGENKELCTLCGFTFYKTQIKQQNGRRVCFRCFDNKGEGGSPPDTNPARAGKDGEV